MYVGSFWKLITIISGQTLIVHLNIRKHANDMTFTHRGETSKHKLFHQQQKCF